MSIAPAPVAPRWPILEGCPEAAARLKMQADLGLAPRTLEAYARGLADYFAVCARDGIDPLTAGDDGHLSVQIEPLHRRSSYPPSVRP